MPNGSVSNAGTKGRKGATRPDPVQQERVQQAQKLRKILQDGGVPEHILGLKDFEALAKRFANNRIIDQVTDQELEEFVENYPRLIRTVFALIDN